MLPEKVVERFWEKVDRGGECWRWIAYCEPQGYGRFRVGDTMIRAHRVSYEIAYGPVPDGLVIDHLCRNQGCVRPDHLEAVTFAENVRRWAKTITHCKHGHAFDESNTRYRKAGSGGRRDCRACGRAATARYLQRKTAR